MLTRIGAVGGRVAAQYSAFKRSPRNILEGTWQTCLQRDGSCTKRVYGHLVKGVGQFEAPALNARAAPARAAVRAQFLGFPG